MIHSLNLSRIRCVTTLDHHCFRLFRALADGKCSESTSCSNATAIADRPIYIDNANNHKKLHKGPKSRSKYRESRSKSRELRSRPTNRIFKHENDNDKKSKNLRKKITDKSFELSNGIDNRLKADRIRRFNTVDDFLQRVLKKNINTKCNKFLKNINKSRSFLKKRIQKNSNLKKKNFRKNFLLLKKDIQVKALFDKSSYRQSIIFKIKEGIYIKRILRKNIKKYYLFLKINFQSKTLFIDESNQQILILTQTDICENLLKNNIQAKELLAEISNQQRAIIVKKYNLDNSLLLKKEKLNEDKSILLPKKKGEKTLLLKINLIKQSIQGTGKKDLLSKKENIHKDLINAILQLIIKDIGDPTLFSKNYILKNPHFLTKKNVNNSSKENISIDPLIQLMDKHTKKKLESSKYIFNEKIFLVIKTSSEDFFFLQLFVCVKKNSLLLQRKDISDDIKLTPRIQNYSLLTKDLFSLSQKEKNIPESLQLQLVKNNVQGNSLLTKSIFSLTKKIIFSFNQDISSVEREKDISKNLSSKLTKRTVQDYFSLIKQFCSLSRENISLVEKKKRLSQSTKRTIYNCLSLNKNLIFKQTRDLIDFPYQSSIVDHYRYHLLSKVPQQILQEFKKVWEKCNRESDCKAKRSLPPEEDWLSQRLTEFDNDGSTDKDDLSIAKCKLTDSYHYTKYQLIVKPPEVHITISKISSCPKQQTNSPKGSSEANFIAESSESVSRCTNFEKDLKNFKDQIIKIEDPEKVLRIQAIKIKREKILLKPIVEIKDFEKILKNPIIKIKDHKETLTSQVIKVNSHALLTVKIIGHLEDSNHYQLIIRKNLQLSNRINHQLIKSDRQLSLIVNSLKTPENILKYPSIKIKELITKIYSNNSSALKIINNLESLNNRRKIQESYCLLDHQSDDLQLPIVKQKLLESNRSSESISRFHKNFKMKLTVRLIRIRDKLVLGLSAFAIVFTLLLVMDLQMDLGYSGHHLIPSHARVKAGDPPNANSIYNNFRRKFLQRGNGSREQANSDTTPVVEKSGKSELTSSSSTMRKHDDFADLMDLIVDGYAMNIDEGVARIDKENREYNPTIGELKKMTPR